MSFNSSELIDIRDFREGDSHFVKASWIRGLRFGNFWFSIIPSSIYYKVYSKVIDVLMNRTTTTIKVACLKEDTDVIVGYSVFSGDNLHWIFVKPVWRKIGVGKRLFPDNIKTVTHLTSVGWSIMKKHPQIIFNPFDL